jgi:hypothetical protein
MLKSARREGKVQKLHLVAAIDAIGECEYPLAMIIPTSDIVLMSFSGYATYTATRKPVWQQ